MAKQKYDWTALKAEFLASPDFEEVSVFLRERIGRNTSGGYFAKMTKWWSMEKKAVKESALQEAKSEITERLGSNYAVTGERLAELHKEFIELLDASMEHIRTKCGLSYVWGKPVLKTLPDLNGLTKIWKMLRTERDGLSALEGGKRLIIHENDLVDEYEDGACPCCNKTM